MTLFPVTRPKTARCFCCKELKTGRFTIREENGQLTETCSNCEENLMKEMALKRQKNQCHNFLSLTYVNKRIIIMSRPCHPNKHIEDAVCHAEKNGWRWKKPGKAAHVWGTIMCPLEDREGCRYQIFSTPRSPENHAKQIRRMIEKCNH